MARARLTRREFVKTGAGLVLAFYLPPRPLGAAPAGGAASDFAPNAWLKIGADGAVTLTLDKSEMGQGSPTGLAMVLAEELAADWPRGGPGPRPGNPAAWAPRSAPG